MHIIIDDKVLYDIKSQLNRFSIETIVNSYYMLWFWKCQDIYNVLHFMGFCLEQFIFNYSSFDIFVYSFLSTKMFYVLLGSHFVIVFVVGLLKI